MQEVVCFRHYYERVWIYLNENIGLGHRRLSIIDTENTANQPMLSSNKKWVIAFNGEIYNYKELKQRFSIQTQTNSDTEVLLHLYEKMGDKNLVCSPNEDYCNLTLKTKDIPMAFTMINDKLKELEN